MSKLPLPVKGSTETFLDTDYAKQVVESLNAVLSMQVAPIANVGSTKFSGGVFVLDLALLDSRLRAIERYFTAANIRLTETIGSINNVSANAACNPNSNTITFNWSFPNVPAV